MNNLSTARRVPATWLFTLAIAVSFAFVGAGVFAQGTSELAATYGRGVHAYFADQSDAAEELFSEVINAGSRDPRVYYFRAMARINCGRQYEAEQDMKVGAALEARDPGNRYAVSKALERIQGPSRQTLEAIRQQARLDRVQQRQQMSRDRYETLEQRGGEVLRREMPVPLEDLVEPSLAVPGAAPSAKAAPKPVVPPSDPSPSPPVPPSDAAEVDPFADEPATESPAPAEPAESTPPPVEPTPPQDDFFEDPAPAAEPEESEQPEPPQDPADEAEEDDPFAGEPVDAADSTTTTAEVGHLEESDRVESGQLVGIIGRVAASVLPWQGIELPQVGPLGGPETEPAEIALGPIEEDSALSPAAAEEPVAAETEDAFGESETAAATEPADDLFGDVPTESAETPATEEPASETPPATSEDAFEF